MGGKKFLSAFLSAALTLSLVPAPALAEAVNGGEEDLLTAQEAAKYTITYQYDDDGKTPDLVNETSVNGYDAAAPTQNPEREGYEFQGWKAGTEEALTPTASLATKQYTENTTVVAQWKKIHTVSFEMNGHGTTPPDPRNTTEKPYGDWKVVDGNLATEPTDPTADGYDFVGWFSDADLTVPFDWTAKIEADTTAYAKWAVASLTVTYGVMGLGSNSTYQILDMPGKLVPDSSGQFAVEDYDSSGYRLYIGDISGYVRYSSQATFSYGDALTKPATDPSVDDYYQDFTFVGWVDAEGKAIKWDGLQVLTDTTIYAMFEENAEHRGIATFTFHVDGKDDAVVSYKYGASDIAGEVPADPAKAGYTFQGWQVMDKDGKLVDWVDDKAEAEVAIKEFYSANFYDDLFDENIDNTKDYSVDVYAKFTEDKASHTVQYLDLNDPDPDDAQPIATIVVDRDATLDERATAEGYDGWYTYTEETVEGQTKIVWTKYDFGTPVTSDLKLYERKEATVTLVDVASDAEPVVQKAYVGDWITVAIPEEPEGMDFRGYFTKDKNGKYEASENFYYGTRGKLNTPGRIDSTYYDGDEKTTSIEVTGDKTYYTLWVAKVTLYNKDGDNIRMDGHVSRQASATEVLYGEKLEHFAKLHYEEGDDAAGYKYDVTYDGWWTQKTVKDDQGQDKQVWDSEFDLATPVTEPLSLYARAHSTVKFMDYAEAEDWVFEEDKWTETEIKSVTVEYDALSDKKFAEGDVPTKTGNVIRWYSSIENAEAKQGENATSAELQDMTIWGDLTLYATYDPSYLVKLDANYEGAAAIVDQTFTYGEPAKLPTADELGLARKGYEFLGWAATTAKAEAGTVDFADGATVSNNLLWNASGATTTLYAVWGAVSYELVLVYTNEDTNVTQTATITRYLADGNRALPKFATLTDDATGEKFDIPEGKGLDKWTDDSNPEVTYADGAAFEAKAAGTTTTLRATLGVAKYTVTLDLNGGTVNGQSTVTYQRDYNAALGFEGESPSYAYNITIPEGYALFTWAYSDGTFVSDWTTPVTSDITLKAEYVARNASTLVVKDPQNNNAVAYTWDGFHLDMPYSVVKGQIASLTNNNTIYDQYINNAYGTGYYLEGLYSDAALTKKLDVLDATMSKDGDNNYVAYAKITDVYKLEILGLALEDGSKTAGLTAEQAASYDVTASTDSFESFAFGCVASGYFTEVGIAGETVKFGNAITAQDIYPNAYIEGGKKYVAVTSDGKAICFEGLLVADSSGNVTSADFQKVKAGSADSESEGTYTQAVSRTTGTLTVLLAYSIADNVTVPSTVTFDSDNAEVSFQAITADTGSLLAKPTKTFAHYTAAFYKDAARTQEFDFATDKVKGDMVIYVKAVPISFGLTFTAGKPVDQQGVSVENEVSGLPTTNATAPYGEKFTLGELCPELFAASFVAPTVEYNTFVGWAVNGKAVTADTQITMTDNLKVDAQWVLTKVVEVPQVKNDLVYTGEELEAVAASDDYVVRYSELIDTTDDDVDNIDIVDDEPQFKDIKDGKLINAGKYVARVRLASKTSIWRDGSAEEKDIIFTVAKAEVDPPAPLENASEVEQTVGYATGHFVHFTYDGTEKVVAEIPDDALYKIEGIYDDVDDPDQVDKFYSTSGTKAGNYRAYIVLKDPDNYTWKRDKDSNPIDVAGYYYYDSAVHDGEPGYESYDLLWFIDPIEVAVPAGQMLYFNGEPQLGIPESDFYTIKGTTETNVGEYNTRLELKDPESTIWDNGSDKPYVYVKWGITTEYVTVQFWNGTELFATQTVKRGNKTEIADVPVKESTAEKAYPFVGWTIYDLGEENSFPLEEASFDYGDLFDGVGFVAIYAGQWFYDTLSPEMRMQMALLYGVGTSQAPGSYIWMNNSTEDVSPYSPTVDCYAVFGETARKYNVTFQVLETMSVDVENMPETQSVAYGAYAAKPEVDPSAEGWTFDGFYLAGTDKEFDFATTPITADTTIDCRFSTTVSEDAIAEAKALLAEGYLDEDSQSTLEDFIALAEAGDITESDFKAIVEGLQEEAAEAKAETEQAIADAQEAIDSIQDEELKQGLIEQLKDARSADEVEDAVAIAQDVDKMITAKAEAQATLNDLDRYLSAEDKATLEAIANGTAENMDGENMLKAVTTAKTAAEAGKQDEEHNIAAMEAVLADTNNNLTAEERAEIEQAIAAVKAGTMTVDEFGAIYKKYSASTKTLALPVPVVGLIYTGEAQTGVVAATGYKVEGNVQVEAGTYVATVTLDADYKWSDGTTETKTVEWSISPKRIAVPKAKTGLKYNGKVQVGVASGEGYKLSGTYKAKAAKTYKVTASLKDVKNYIWSDGTIDDVEISWSIAKLANTLTVKAKKFTYKASALKKAAKTIAATAVKKGNKASTKITYKLVSVKGKKAKSYITYSKGAIKVKKGTPKGKYVVTIRATAKASAKFKAAKKTFKVTVTVK